MSIATFVVIFVSAFASLLTFFSGFGLNTLLMPTFAVFVPLRVAVLMAAIVHLANNIFKLLLMFRYVNWRAFLAFGLPACLAAIGGAYVLTQLALSQTLFSYQLFGRAFEVSPLSLVMGLIILGFALFEAIPRMRTFSLSSKWMPLGGVLSGFFGGLSGHQGALRTVFLLRLNLSKDAFVATGIAIACVVDVVRLFVYAQSTTLDFGSLNTDILVVAMMAAFAGAILGRYGLKLVSFDSIRQVVFVLLLILGLGITAGII